MIHPGRNKPGYLAFLLHRLSGLALVLFLPAHFLVLGMALNESAFDAAIATWITWPYFQLCMQNSSGPLASDPTS